MSARTAWIEGIALWAPLLPGWDVARAVLRGDAPPPATPAGRPAPPLLAPTERRRAPDTVAVALEVALRACESAARDPKTLPSVFASTHGDLTISDYMCETLAKTPTLISPVRFHNSVHNAAAGYWTIGTGCMRPYTSLTAFEHSFGEALLEGLVMAESEQEPVLVVAYDIAARGPMATMVPSRSLLGAALVISPSEGPAARARVDWDVVPRPRAASTPAVPRNAALVEGNAMAGCLAVFEALAGDLAEQVMQTLGPDLALDLKIIPVTRAE